MKIAIVGGTGKLGQGLGLRAVHSGHDVTLGSRDADRARETAALLDPAIGGQSNRDAAEGSDAVFLSVPYAAHRGTIEPLREVLAGKLVIDATVPINPFSPRELRTDSGRSAAEEADEILGGNAAVFAAFQTVSFHTLRQDEVQTDILLAGDPDRKDDALALIRSLNVHPVYAGPLRSARHLEHMTLLLIAINKHHKIKNAGLKILGI
jgi:NADPH-dependent F420 reductase